MSFYSIFIEDYRWIGCTVLLIELMTLIVLYCQNLNPQQNRVTDFTNQVGDGIGLIINAIAAVIVLLFFIGYCIKSMTSDPIFMFPFWIFCWLLFFSLLTVYFKLSVVLRQSRSA